jgi:hypothetical protein
MGTPDNFINKMSKFVGSKRTSSSNDTGKNRATKKQRKITSSQELPSKALMGKVPIFSMPSIALPPNVLIVNKLRGIIETGLKSQKQIAKENGIRLVQIIFNPFFFLVLFKYVLPVNTQQIYQNIFITGIS